MLVLSMDSLLNDFPLTAQSRSWASDLWCVPLAVLNGMHGNPSTRTELVLEDYYWS